MIVIINGDKKEVKDSITLLKFIQELNLESQIMAAAVNMNIVKQNEWGNSILNENDKIELLDFVGGG
ncbi:MAG: sulfur carrier protein ThiS [Helicobacteraceae bacterium]|nr:sulfur carrier protein ThiS [Helicobacteraceae bacterium]